MPDDDLLQAQLARQKKVVGALRELGESDLLQQITTTGLRVGEGLAERIAAAAWPVEVEGWDDAARPMRVSLQLRDLAVQANEAASWGMKAAETRVGPTALNGLRFLAETVATMS
jgi:hypothetical protein